MMALKNIYDDEWRHRILDTYFMLVQFNDAMHVDFFGCSLKKNSNL